MLKNRTLYFGDNLQVIREKFPSDEGYFDLIYLDPPFNSNRSYNVLFKEGIEESPSQIHAFEDSWHWTRETDQLFDEIITSNTYPQKISDLLVGLEKLVKKNDMLAYITMMSVRLVELHRVLKENGTLYLHCDPTASHYLKLVLDAIFGGKHFRNEIIWHYPSMSRTVTDFPRKHDVIFRYTKSDNWTFNANDILIPYASSTVARSKYGGAGFSRKEGGANYLVRDGKVPDTVWDIPHVKSKNEHLGYPTQKPEALMDRIIKASSKEGDWILDPFGGCGTTVAVSENLKRNWIMIDITPLSINLVKRRIEKSHPEIASELFVDGYPADFSGAKELAIRDRFAFELWACDLLEARPSEGKTRQNNRGSDRGIDGIITFKDIEAPNSNKIIYRKLLVQVKSGANISSKDIRDLRGTLEREKVDGGIFVTLEEPTKPMQKDADEAGSYTSNFNGQKFPVIQILTVEELMKGEKPNAPSPMPYSKEAKKVSEDGTASMF